MAVKNIVILDKGSEFKGEIISGQLILEGRVRGQIKVKNRILLKKGSIMEGEVVAGNLTMEEGANFRGELLVRSSDDIFNEKPDKGAAERELYESEPVGVPR